MITKLRVESRNGLCLKYVAQIPSILVTVDEVIDDGGSSANSLLSSRMGGKILGYSSKDGNAVFEGEIPIEEESLLPSRLLRLKKEILRRNKFLQT